MAELYHVGLTVRDLDRSIAFYRDVVGLAVGETKVIRTDEFSDLTDNPDAEIRYAHLTAGGFTLQLIEYLKGGGVSLELRHNNIGNPHLCFFVPDAASKFSDVRDRGDVEVTSDLLQITPTKRSFYTADPDGIPVEFLEQGDR